MKTANISLSLFLILSISHLSSVSLPPPLLSPSLPSLLICLSLSLSPSIINVPPAPTHSTSLASPTCLPDFSFPILSSFLPSLFPFLTLSSTLHRCLCLSLPTSLVSSFLSSFLCVCEREKERERARSRHEISSFIF